MHGYSSLRGIYEESMLNLTQSIFSCDVKSIDWSTFKHYFASELHKSRSFIRYSACMAKYVRDVPTDDQRYNHASVLKCRDLIATPCTTSNFRVIKSIRMPMFLVSKLLERDRSIKVIYFPRDPRAIFASRWRAKYGGPGVTDAPISQQCFALADDLSVAMALQKHMPHNVLIVPFEDLAKDPLKITQQIYDFVGKEMTPQVTDWLEKNTKCHKPDSIWGNARNSSAVVDHWRRDLTLLNKNRITKLCDKALKLIGYE